MLTIGFVSATSGTSISVDATVATTRTNSFVIELVDFTLVQRKAPFDFYFAIVGVENQISSKEAGGFDITTFYKGSDDLYYVIDTGKVDTSFVATPAFIDGSGSIVPSDLTNNAEGV